MAYVEIDPYNLADGGSGAGIIPFLADEIKQRIIEDDIDGLKHIMAQIERLSEQLIALNGEVDEKRREYTRMRNRMRDLEEQAERQRKAREALMSDMRKEFGIAGTAAGATVASSSDDTSENEDATDTPADTSVADLFSSDLADLDIPSAGYAADLEPDAKDSDGVSYDDTDMDGLDDTPADLFGGDDIPTGFDFGDDEDDTSTDDVFIDDDFDIDFDGGYDSPTAMASSGDAAFDFDSSQPDPFSFGDDDADPFSFSSTLNGAGDAAYMGDATLSTAPFQDDPEVPDDDYAPVDAGYDDEEQLLARIAEEKKDVDRRRRNTVYSDIDTSVPVEEPPDEYDGTPPDEDDVAVNDIGVGDSSFEIGSLFDNDLDDLSTPRSPSKSNSPSSVDNATDSADQSYDSAPPQHDDAIVSDTASASNGNAGDDETYVPAGFAGSSVARGGVSYAPDLDDDDFDDDDDEYFS